MNKPLAVFIAWKDIRNPAAGGAELVHQEWSKSLIRDGFDVIHLVPGFRGCTAREVVDGVEIRRFGRNVLAFYAATLHYRRLLRDRTDLLVDVFNCVGSFALTFGARCKAVFVIHHVQDRMWFFQTSFAGVPRWLMPFINGSGYLVEKLQLRLLAYLHRGPVVTVSESTSRELQSYGFRKPDIGIAHNGCTLQPLVSLDGGLSRFERFTALMIGPRKSKRPMQTLKAFGLFQRRHPDTGLIVAGWGTEQPRMEKYARGNGLRNVVFEGRITDERKQELMQRCHVLCTTPVKEGWGIIVNEANAMGTPVIAYDVPGLRDALQFGNGFLCPRQPEAMAATLESLHDCWWNDRTRYRDLCAAALESSRQWSFARSYREFRAACGM